MTRSFVRANRAPEIPRQFGAPTLFDLAPATFGDAEKLARFLVEMQRRAGSRRNTAPVVYLAGAGHESANPAAAMRHRAELDVRLAPARMVSRQTVWSAFGRPGALGQLPPYPAGIDAMAAAVDGMVVMLPAHGTLRADVADEVTAGRTARLPILVRAPGGLLVPLVDCRTAPAGDGGTRVELPAAADDRETLRAALAAIGVERWAA
jgi:hypothetical protein